MMNNNKVKWYELKQIELLLYGLNYEISLNIYGAGEPDASLEHTLQLLVSKDSTLLRVSPSTSQCAMENIREMILYEGGIGHGPNDLSVKKKKINKLLDQIFERIAFESADLVAKFDFTQGNPIVPIFWGFAYDIHSQGQRWIFIGVSTD